MNMMCYIIFTCSFYIYIYIPISIPYIEPPHRVLRGGNDRRRRYKQRGRFTDAADAGPGAGDYCCPVHGQSVISHGPFPEPAD